MTFDVDESGNGTAKLRDALRKIARTEVYIGIPEDKAERRENDVTNAQLLYIHSHGSALRNIPARPVIEPAIEAPDNKALITRELGDAAREVIDQDAPGARSHLDKAGMLGRNAAIRWFTDGRNGWAPNSASTAKHKGSDRPLIDTGQMRRSITYVVEED